MAAKPAYGIAPLFFEIIIVLSTNENRLEPIKIVIKVMVGNDTAKAHHNSTSPNPMALKKESFLKIKRMIRKRLVIKQTSNNTLIATS